jgi:hypothetical protein
MAPISRFHFRAVWIIAILLAALLVATVIVDRIPIAKSTIQTDVIINSSASEVWQELTDFEEYPQWNHFMLQPRRTIGDSDEVWRWDHDHHPNCTCGIAR